MASWGDVQRGDQASARGEEAAADARRLMDLRPDGERAQPRGGDL